MIGHEVNEDILEMDINWEWLYEKLSKGEYRIVKSATITKDNSYLDDKYVYVKFIVE